MLKENYDYALNEINKSSIRTINNKNNKNNFQKTPTAFLLEFMYLIHQENLAVLAGLVDETTLNNIKDIYNKQADKIIKEYSKVMVDELI